MHNEIPEEGTAERYAILLKNNALQHLIAYLACFSSCREAAILLRC